MRCTVVCVATAVLLAAGEVHAQSNGASVSRREWIERAQSASNAGDHVLAVDLATRAAGSGVTPSLRLFLGEQLGYVGRWTDALANAEQCLRDVEADLLLSNRDALAAGCRELRDTARANVATVRVQHLPAPTTGLIVRLNGRIVALDALSAPYAIDPGPVVLEVIQGGRPIERREFVAARGVSNDVSLAAARTTASPTARVFAPRRRSAAPYVLASTSAASFIAAGVFFGLRQIAQGPCALSGRLLVCPTPQDAERAQQAITYNAAADVALGVGAATLVAGVIWWIVDHRAMERPAVRATIAPLASGFFAGAEFPL